MTVLVTGATGFVGSAVRASLRARGQSYRSATRNTGVLAAGEDKVPIRDLSGATDWTGALDGVSTVVHLAARVHVRHETAADALSEFRRVNTSGTERLARAAASAGARRFVFVSSIKVNGESTTGRPFDRADRRRPLDPYGVSKSEAEVALFRVADETGLEIVVVRPPLVYGPNVGGNFLRLLKLVHSGLPLPFGAARNLRSLVFVDNLADLLVTCAFHPRAAGQTFLASDGEDISTADLCSRLARALKKDSRLVPLPLAAVRGGARLIGRLPEYERLFGSLQVDSNAQRVELGWSPPHTVDQGLAATAAWFSAC
jgi:nucleoside-diphosphate-sugar epimerase